MVSKPLTKSSVCQRQSKSKRYSKYSLSVLSLGINTFIFQSNNLQDTVVDPVLDDIEITHEGEGTDAFAVRTS